MTPVKALRLVLLVYFLGFLCMVFPVTSLAENPSLQGAAVSSEGGSTDYIIGPQNVLQIKIFGDASANQIYRVDERGYIRHALLGSVKIGGISVSDAEKFMEKSLAGDYIIDPRVTIFVLEHSHFSVIGEVKRPGVYEILGRATVIEAISTAGGFSQVANQRNVKIIKKKNGKESIIGVDTTRITQRGEISADTAIEADDVISVQKSFF